MNDKDTGGQAFPVCGIAFRNGQQIEHVSDKGMTLRDYFAAKSLPSIISAYHAQGNSFSSENAMDICADVAYGYADAMLKARES